VGQGFGYRWGEYRRRLGEATIDVGVDEVDNLGVQDPLGEVINFVCDPRLKRHVVKTVTSVLGPTYPMLHAYKWVWSEEATRLYGLMGESQGLMTPEVNNYFPDKVKTSGDGVQYISITPTHDAESDLLMDAMVKLKLNLELKIKIK
jgi:hypothetical protein